MISIRDGSEYNGNLDDGKKTGKGVFKFPKDDPFCSVYEGEFLNDNFHGKGKLYFKNGGIYDGDFYLNLMHG